MRIADVASAGLALGAVSQLLFVTGRQMVTLANVEAENEAGLLRRNEIAQDEEGERAMITKLERKQSLETQLAALLAGVAKLQVALAEQAVSDTLKTTSIVNNVVAEIANRRVPGGGDLGQALILTVPLDRQDKDGQICATQSTSAATGGSVRSYYTDHKDADGRGLYFTLTVGWGDPTSARPYHRRGTQPQTESK